MAATYALLNGYLNRLLDQLGILSARQNHQRKSSRRDLVGDFELNDRRPLLGHSNFRVFLAISEIQLDHLALVQVLASQSVISRAIDGVRLGPAQYREMQRMGSSRDALN